MKVLGIETSCDETGVAIYDSEVGLLADCLYSQVEIHAKYGGVIPELASRDHIRKTLPLIEEVIEKAGIDASEIEGVAYTLSTEYSPRPLRMPLRCLLHPVRRARRTHRADL